MKKTLLLPALVLAACAWLGADNRDVTNTQSIPLVPIVSSSAEGSHVLKTTAGSLVSGYVTTGTTAGFLMTFDAATAPNDGAVTPRQCVVAPANSTTSLSAQTEPYSTGIIVVFSSTGCFTKTASATAYFHWSVR